MVSVRRNPSSSESSRKRIREEEVGGLRSSKGAQRAEFSFSLQVVEVWPGRRGRGHVDDSGRSRGFKVGNQQTRQKERPQVVRGEHLLETLGRHSPTAHNDGGVVDQNVQLRVFCPEFGSETANRGQQGQVCKH